ncbi:MAG TPA: hypothetical protein VGQ46_17645 [Thermoanaerobaculia bacterium]|nr:hypothetical protein [Thermoanaerobaculia bacterium]
MTSTDTEAPAVRISGWKLYAVTFGSILFAAMVAALIWVLGPSAAPIQLPSYVWSAIGFCVLGLLLIPTQRIVAPEPYISGRVTTRDAIIGVLIGSFLYAGAMHLML